MSFDYQFARIQALLVVEECEPASRGALAITERLARRQAIRAQLAQLCADIERATSLLNRLPVLPELSCLQWAHSLLAFPNGRILVVDTTFPAESASLLQVLVLDFTGQVRLHRCVATGRSLSHSEMTRFGINPQEIQEAVPLPQLWPALLEALHGCYLLVYDLRQIRLILEQEAQRHQLEQPVVIGDDLLVWATRCYQQSGRTSLPSLCELIGHPLPPYASILERAYGQFVLLQAMAQEIIRE